MVSLQAMKKVWARVFSLINSARRLTCACALPVCLFVCTGLAPAQQASAPARPMSATAAPTAPPAKLTPAKGRAAIKTESPLPVIAVVHRLSGWRLRALLTRPDGPVASTVDDQFTRTNIVAGYVLADGRSVVARLPRADAEMLDLSAQFPNAGLPTAAAAVPLSLLRGDGVEFKAHFVGLDARTGLSLLEAEQSFAALAPERSTFTPTVGQRVRVIAPVPAGAHAVSAADSTLPNSTNAPVSAAATTAPPDSAPAGETGTIYMSLSEAQGQLRQINRSPTGRPIE